MSARRAVLHALGPDLPDEPGAFLRKRDLVETERHRRIGKYRRVVLGHRWHRYSMTHAPLGIAATFRSRVFLPPGPYPCANIVGQDLPESPRSAIHMHTD